MNYADQRNLFLFSRNEGKLKSYESCFDLRAWSHDIRVRDQYLREWMKCTMPSSVFPLSTVNSLLKSMTCKRFGRLAPRCHPDCKSKKLLESICASCQAMKECLKSNENFEKIFEEEELETGNWPCDKCLSALKNIRIFWKVLLDKIFKVTIPKTEKTSEEHPCTMDGVHNVAKVWQKEILEQAAFVRNLIPSITKNSFLWKQTKSSKSDTDTSYSPNDIKQAAILISDGTVINIKQNLSDLNLKHRNSNFQCNCKCNERSHKHKTNKCTTTSTVKLLHTGCDPLNDALKSFRSYFKDLQEQYQMQTRELEILTKENILLKKKLREVCKKCSRKSLHTPAILNKTFSGNQILKSYETSSEENLSTDLSKDTDSEVIITLKNCKHENFKHVCMLQVVHKTNEPTEDFSTQEEGYPKKQDPVDLLSKVQKTFGNIVRKELSIANRKYNYPTRQVVNATFVKNTNNSFKSASSCSTMSSCWSKHSKINDYVEACDVRSDSAWKCKRV